MTSLWFLGLHLNILYLLHFTVFSLHHPLLMCFVSCQKKNHYFVFLPLKGRLLRVLLLCYHKKVAACNRSPQPYYKYLNVASNAYKLLCALRASIWIEWTEQTWLFFVKIIFQRFVLNSLWQVLTRWFTAACFKVTPFILMHKCGPLNVSLAVWYLKLQLTFPLRRGGVERWLCCLLRLTF